MTEKRTPPPAQAPAAGDVDYGPLPQLLGYHLRRAQIAVFAHFARTMADYQITPGKFAVLTLIEANPGLTQSALAKAMGIERSTMVAVIDGLENLGLIERRRSPVDRRSYALTLTSGGRALVATLTERVLGHERHISTALRAGEKRTLIELLRRIEAGCRTPSPEKREKPPIEGAQTR